MVIPITSKSRANMIVTIQTTMVNVKVIPKYRDLLLKTVIYRKKRAKITTFATHLLNILAQIVRNIMKNEAE